MAFTLQLGAKPRGSFMDNLGRGHHDPQECSSLPGGLVVAIQISYPF